MKRLVAAIGISLALSTSSAFAAHVLLVVKPAAVASGGIVTISAASSPCLLTHEHVTQQVTLISAAFPGRAFGGEGAVNGRIGTKGSFTIHSHTRTGLRPGRYPVTARCGGGNLNALAYIHIR